MRLKVVATLRGAGDRDRGLLELEPEARANRRRLPRPPPRPRRRKTAIRSGELQVIVGSATGNSPCEKAAPTPASPGQVGAGGGGSRSERRRRVAGARRARHGEADAAHARAARRARGADAAGARGRRASTRRRASALRRRLRRSRRRTCRASARTTRTSGSPRSSIPSQPSELLYDGTTPDAKIVGLSYLVFHHDGPPPGFAGPTTTGTSTTPTAACACKGGVVVGGEDVSRAGVRGPRRPQDAAHRHLDGARVGRARLRVQLGRVQRRVPGARRPARRHRLGGS